MDYRFPHGNSVEEMKTPEFAEKMKQGPVGIIADRWRCLTPTLSCGRVRWLRAEQKIARLLQRHVRRQVVILNGDYRASADQARETADSQVLPPVRHVAGGRMRRCANHTVFALP